MKTAIELIAAERARQTSEEGWMPGHDDQHTSSELAKAAACYAQPAIVHHRNPADDEGCVFRGAVVGYPGPDSLTWPFEVRSWKRSYDNPIRNLVKAGALIAAEIDRLQRQAARNSRMEERRESLGEEITREVGQ